MENFNNVPSTGKFGESIAVVNENFLLAQQKMEELQALYNALQQTEPEIIEPSDTWPVANPEEGVIYRVIDRVNTPPQYYSDFMWNGTSMVQMARYNNAIDDEPTPGSNNLVKSGGVAANIVYDISAAHSGTTYADLASALGTNGANVPVAVRKGGMSVKFVQSSDNKYLQFRYMLPYGGNTTAENNKFVNPTNWQGVDDEPTAGSDNLVKSGGVYDGISELDQEINGKDNSVDTEISVTSAEVGVGCTIIKDVSIKKGTYGFAYDDTIIGSGAYLYVKYKGTDSFVTASPNYVFVNISEIVLSDDVIAIKVWANAVNCLAAGNCALSFVDKNPISGIVDDIEEINDKIEEIGSPEEKDVVIAEKEGDTVSGSTRHAFDITNLNIKNGQTFKVVIESSTAYSAIYLNYNNTASNLKPLVGVNTFVAPKNITSFQIYTTSSANGHMKVTLTQNIEGSGLFGVVGSDSTPKSIEKNQEIASGISSIIVTGLNLKKGTPFKVSIASTATISNVTVWIEPGSSGTAYARNVSLENLQYWFAAAKDHTTLQINVNSSTSGQVNVVVSYTEDGNGALGDIDKNNHQLTFPLMGKKVVWFGDSFTQGYKWCQKINELFGFNATNCGVGGTAICNEGGDASMCQESRIDGTYSPVTDPITGIVTRDPVAMPIDADIVFVLGGGNDWGRNYPFGQRAINYTNDVLDVDDTTVYGASHQMFDLLEKRCPNAIIICLGSTFFRALNSTYFSGHGVTNSLGLQSIDYGDAVCDIAGLHGHLAFNVGRIVGANDNNILELTAGDGVHCNTERYAQKVARVVIDRLMQYQNSGLLF